MNHQSFTKLCRSGCAFGVLFVAMLACYTPMQATEAEQRAIAQLEAAMETLDYIPPDAVLLAEKHNSTGYTGVEREYVGAEVSRLYGIDWTCEEIVADYEAVMVDAEWRQRLPSRCDYPVWLSFYLESGEEFTIYAKPFEGVDFELDEDVVRQFQTTYFVNFRVRIPIE